MQQMAVAEAARMELFEDRLCLLIVFWDLHRKLDREVPILVNSINRFRPKLLNIRHENRRYQHDVGYPIAIEEIVVLGSMNSNFDVSIHEITSK